MYYGQLHVASGENNLPINLNIFETETMNSHIERDNNSIVSLAVVFKNDASLCKCAGLKFFSDPLGVNMIKQIDSGKDKLTKLSPLLFKSSNVYCQYYFNTE